MGEPTSLEIIGEFVELLGSHVTECQFLEPGQGCMLHLKMFEERRRAAAGAIERIERGLGL